MIRKIVYSMTILAERCFSIIFSVVYEVIECRRSLEKRRLNEIVANSRTQAE